VHAGSITPAHRTARPSRIRDGFSFIRCGQSSRAKNCSLNIYWRLTILRMKRFGPSTPAGVRHRAAVSRCWRTQRERLAVQVREGSAAPVENDLVARRPNDGIVRIGVDVVVHIDVLKQAARRSQVFACAVARASRRKLKLGRHECPRPACWSSELGWSMTCRSVLPDFCRRGPKTFRPIQ
jgi:hypothetical protein